MGKFRMAAIDLDDTLLDDKKQISARSLAALDDAVDRGIEIVPASGRALEGVLNVLKYRPGLRYYILLNGSEIWDQALGKTLSVSTVKPAYVEAILDEVEDADIPYTCAIGGEYCVDAELREHLDRYIPPESPIYTVIRDKRRCVPDMRGYIRRHPGMVEMISIVVFDKDLKSRIMEHLKDSYPSLQVTTSADVNIEVSAPDAQKGEALKYLAENLGIRPDEIAAFGDNLNDVSMIEYAGLGVAMGNALPQVKEVADFITAANTEDGVARVLERL